MRTLPLRLALAQINSTVGAIEDNARRVRDETQRAKAAGAELVVFPELTLCGYPPKDLLTHPGFVLRCERALAELSAAGDWSAGVTVVVGCPLPHAGPGQGLHNTAAVIQDGRLSLAHKVLLPGYDVFDEPRYFDPGGAPLAVDVRGVRVGIAICEDVWNDKQFWTLRRYLRDPAAELAAAGAQLIVSLNASPYAMGKPVLRERMLASLARQHRLPIAYVNLVGGNDALLFDGQSCLVAADGEVIGRGPAWSEALWLSTEGGLARLAEPGSEAEAEEVLDGLALGVRDYLRKTGFREVLIGSSGGIDSALTAVIAVRALGPSAVRTVAMPSRYNAQMSAADAAELAARLGIRHDVIPIERLRAAFWEELAPHFGPLRRDGALGLAGENLQSRLRGTALMALSNESGALLLNTGNKSEYAVGYCTQYGDMNGALSVIGDLTKTQVYRLARHVNHARELIPRRVLERPPSAELRDGQVDQDTLPPYDVLDRILALAVEEGRSQEEIAALGFQAPLIRDILRRLVQSEYKRRQSAPILRVTGRAFGEGWRYPLAQGYREENHEL